MVTLGYSKTRYGKPYKGKISLDFNLGKRAAVIAPVDMTLIGYKNRNAEYRIVDGNKYRPFDDLQLWFESDDPNWPNMIITCYHLFSSPLLYGHMIDEKCSRCEKWGDDYQGEGVQYYETNEIKVPANENSTSCRAILGRKIKKGEVIGYAGTVGEDHFVSFGFKVWSDADNPTVRQGYNRNLHWVQPESFFNWKSFDGQSESTTEPFLVYPFECGGFELSKEQRDPYFKYDQRWQEFSFESKQFHEFSD